MVNVGIIGSTGYAGQQLVWLLLNHPHVNIDFLSSNSYEGLKYSDIYVSYSQILDEKCISNEAAIEKTPDLDVLFCAMPHGKSMDVVKKAFESGVKVIDLSADFRLKDAQVYKQWYELDHTCADLLGTAVYGLPELHRASIKDAQIIANPGCYPTSAILGIVPILKAGLAESYPIVIDSKSGISGAGRGCDISKLYAEANESTRAYKVASHRHTPEIEQELSSLSGCDANVIFTPHIVPMNRGMLSTCYVKLNKDVDREHLLSMYKDFYKDEYFVKVLDSLPETKWVRGSNFCHIGLSYDNRTGMAVIVSAIDNLMRGAASQAVQNMNIMLDIDEKCGIDFAPMFP
ncbi:N-acetyl-gamma-glutamyl-phosphate reductase [Peptoclostridium litorale DSM 5388]|uniref:N-acetyl-gamma-glutamyl-phosphate reductase n=1 Tax=Peptoclostridium litorale DSM 5388 TaxID=1121324 RepID=A0A069RAS7_PEPLI|nr:N-acetyl-gamma-glutamyl-phosphate reductase [Peptoclostridium litorale]KDR94121.1 N-acetyl-gamma-glutamyl-phosphate reductase ArgC [Peptoclostridium litorale DSM 5388]SIN81133.1 N-acetyl-gamma-glutamyl-phosphate reductase [Peptoclostridium litorale DSM 5388]